MDKTLALTFPAGHIPYTTRQTKAMTVGADTEVLTVPTGKRWLVHYVYMSNVSGVGINVECVIQDDAGTAMAYLINNQALGSGSLLIAPRVTGATTVAAEHASWPMLLGSGMKIMFSWAANAGKAGNSYWFAMIREV